MQFPHKKNFPDWLYRRLAYRLPERLVYWCVIRAGQYANRRMLNPNDISDLDIVTVVSVWQTTKEGVKK